MAYKLSLPSVQVQMPVTSPLQCPISLETPVQCPQITPCGHVFGFVPIMGYLLSHGGQALRKACPCPLCFVPIAARELRGLRFQHIKAPQVGPAHARLCGCSALSTIWLPMRAWLGKEPPDARSHLEPQVTCFSPGQAMHWLHGDAQLAAVPEVTAAAADSAVVQIGDTIALQLLQRPANSILPSMAGSSPPGSPTAGPASAPADPAWALGTAAAAASSQVHRDPPALWGGADTFAKFTRVHDPAPLWRESVHSLAAMGVQVNLGILECLLTSYIVTD